jgi:cytochrome P450
MGQDAIIVNSVEVMTALFAQQSHSGRPQYTFGGELVGWKDFMTHLQEGPVHKEQRRLLVQELGSKAALQRFAPMIEERARALVRDVLDDPSPEVLLSHIRT